MIFVELVTDPFDDVFAVQSKANQSPGGGTARARAGKAIARRPVRGIEIKEDTFAYLKVILSSGFEVPLLDSSHAAGVNASGYTNFILQSVSEARMEKHQIIETFGDSYVFFFGESPRFLDCTAQLINTNDFNWRAEWWHNYEHYLRGTKLVELGGRCYMFWDDNVVEGYMLLANATESADNPYAVNLQFRFFVTKYGNVSLNNVEQFPVRASVQLPPGIELSAPDARDKLQAYYLDNVTWSEPAMPADLSPADSAVARQQPGVGASLSNAGGSVGPLGQNAPLVRSYGPSTYSFAPVGGASAGAGLAAAGALSLSAGLGGISVAGAGAAGAWSGAQGGGGIIGTTRDLGIGEVSANEAAARGTAAGLAAQHSQYVPNTSLGSLDTVSQQLRVLPPAAIADPAVWNAIWGVQGIADLDNGVILSTGIGQGVLRGMIAENIDEYVNGTDAYAGMSAYFQGTQDYYSDPYYNLAAAVRRQQELEEDLAASTVNTLVALGADADNSTTLYELGLGPNFSNGYVSSVGAFASAGAGAGVGASTSFGAASSASVSFSPFAASYAGTIASAGIGASARAGYYTNSYSSAYLVDHYFEAQDPLGAVYGRPPSQNEPFNFDRYRYIEGAGYPDYGYASPYGDVGYGRAGFGDLGGAGFGSANAYGDPGYRDPRRVTAQGTVVTTTFSRIKNDQTVLTAGAALGGTSVVGGASVHVGGVSSAFALTAFKGSMADWAVARAEAGPGYAYAEAGVFRPDVGYDVYHMQKVPAYRTYVSAQSSAVSVSAFAGFY